MRAGIIGTFWLRVLATFLGGLAVAAVVGIVSWWMSKGPARTSPVETPFWAAVVGSVLALGTAALGISYVGRLRMLRRRLDADDFIVTLHGEAAGRNFGAGNPRIDLGTNDVRISFVLDLINTGFADSCLRRVYLLNYEFNGNQYPLAEEPRRDPEKPVHALGSASTDSLLFTVPKPTGDDLQHDVVLLGLDVRVVFGIPHRATEVAKTTWVGGYARVWRS